MVHETNLKSLIEPVIISQSIVIIRFYCPLYVTYDEQLCGIYPYNSDVVYIEVTKVCSDWCLNWVAPLQLARLCVTEVLAHARPYLCVC